MRSVRLLLARMPSERRLLICWIRKGVKKGVFLPYPKGRRGDGDGVLLPSRLVQ